MANFVFESGSTTLIRANRKKKYLAFESVALSHTNDVDHLVLGKDLADRNLLLKVFPSKGHLVRHTPTVQLHLHDVRLLLPGKNIGVNCDQEVHVHIY